MASLKLQANRATPAILSDTINLVDAASLSASGTTTSTTADKLVNTAGLFTTTELIAIGDIVVNTTAADPYPTSAKVTAIDSATTLSLDANIMASGETYEIFRETTDGQVLYIGTAGDLSVVTAGGDSRIFKNIIGGTFFPTNVVRVNLTGTTARDIIALT